MRHGWIVSEVSVRRNRAVRMISTIDGHAIAGLAAGIVRDKERTCRDRNRGGAVNACDMSVEVTSAVFLRPEVHINSLALPTLTNPVCPHLFNVLNVVQPQQTTPFLHSPPSEQVHCMSIGCELAICVRAKFRHHKSKYHRFTNILGSFSM
jgi:hypothetical protein